VRFTQNPASPVVTEVIYGIDLHSLEVERVMIGWDGTAMRRGADGSAKLVRFDRGADFEDQIRAHFALISQVSLPTGIRFEHHPAVIRLHQKSESLKIARGTMPLPFAAGPVVTGPAEPRPDELELAS
jgi:hypothetical protein